MKAAVSDSVDFRHDSVVLNLAVQDILQARNACMYVGSDERALQPCVGVIAFAWPDDPSGEIKVTLTGQNRNKKGRRRKNAGCSWELPKG